MALKYTLNGLKLWFKSSIAQNWFIQKSRVYSVLLRLNVDVARGKVIILAVCLRSFAKPDNDAATEITLPQYV